MEKRTFLVISLVGEILVLAGVFLPWASAAGVNISGLQVADLAPLANEFFPQPYILLAGAVVALLGVLGALFTNVKAISYLIPIGVLILIVAWIWTALTINLGAASFGYWVTVFGVILSAAGLQILRRTK